MIHRLELVLRATLADGTVVEGATRPQQPGLHVTEDARVFHYLDAAALPEGTPSAAYDETLASVLLHDLQQRPIEDVWPNGDKPEDLIDLCLLRLCAKLRERSDPAP
jgi:hypothetical protein